MTAAVLGLGGNIGDPLARMREAVALLDADAQTDVIAASSLYETPPWGFTDQPAFLNAALRIETTRPARDLLGLALATEERLGRRRDVRWGPRTIDIDILIFGDPARPDAVDEPGLRLPHPHLHARAFALMPLLEVAPDAHVAGWPAALWIARVDLSGIRRVGGPEWAQGNTPAGPRDD